MKIPVHQETRRAVEYSRYALFLSQPTSQHDMAAWVVRAGPMLVKAGHGFYSRRLGEVLIGAQ